MFCKKDNDSEALKAQIKGLKKEREDLKLELNELRHKKKMEEDGIKHMVKIKEEKLDIEYKKLVMKNERQMQLEVASVKDEYRDKLEKRLEIEVNNIKEMYGEILERLPNMNVQMKGKL